MKSSQLLAGALFFAHGAWSQFTTPPDTTADPNTVKTCTWWHVAKSGETCASIASSYGLTTFAFTTWNPSLAGTCAIVVGNSYCIEDNWGESPLPQPTGGTTTTSTPIATPSPTSGNGITTPTPTQAGMVGNCNKFHFVSEGDGCGSIQSTYGVSLAQLVAWNPAIGSQCTGMWLNTYLCVGVTGSGTTTAKPTTTTSAGNGITTPTPTQAGMVGNCNKFHFVSQGDGCASIQATYGVTLAQLFSWNPAIGSQCTSMWLNTFLCVGVVGSGTTTTRATTTSTGNGISTPTPTQSGMVGNCDRFHFVVSGDECGAIATRYGIPLASLYSWNPAVGNNCQSLWANTYICVRTIGFVPPTTTTAGGVTTPTPTQAGMVSRCNKFHKVVAGDQCGTLATRYSISLANFYSWNPAVGNNCQSLWAEYYVCVGRA